MTTSAPTVHPTEPLVAVVGGPLGGQWFTRDQWTGKQRATRHSQERCGWPEDHPAAAVLRYVEDGTRMLHPLWKGYSGTVARWPSGRAAATRAERLDRAG